MDAYDRRDYQAAVRLARPLANAGNPRAQYVMGLLHHFGRAVPQDHAEAARWYRLSAAQGNHFAQNNLGALYEQGLGVERNLSEARRLYSAASLSNEPIVRENITRIGQDNPIRQVPAGASTPTQNSDETMIGIIIFAVVIFIGYVFWALDKASKKCPKCKVDYSWNIVSEIDRPIGIFQEKTEVNKAVWGGREGEKSYNVTTYEYGHRTSDYLCKKCGYTSTKEGQYKKPISGSSYSV